MRSFIFVTSEGYTFKPGSESDLPDIENMQVIGFAQGKNAEAAFNHLLIDEPWISKTSFRQVQSIELAYLDYQSGIKSFLIGEAKSETVT